MKKTEAEWNELAAKLEYERESYAKISRRNIELEEKVRTQASMIQDLKLHLAARPLTVPQVAQLLRYTMDGVD